MSFCASMVLFPFLIASDVWAVCAGGNVTLSPRALEASWCAACVSLSFLLAATCLEVERVHPPLPFLRDKVLTRDLMPLFVCAILEGLCVQKHGISSEL